MVDDIGVLRIEADTRLDRVVEVISRGISAAREAGVRKLLVDSRDVGLASISLADRHWMVREWADAGQGKVTLAMLTSAALIDSERFGITVAANFGMVSNVFSGEEVAMTWLRNQV